MMTKRLQIRRYFALRTALMLNIAAFPWLSMTSYAADYTTQQQVAQITEYSSQQVATLGQWETQADATVKFKTYTGEYLTNAWLQDPSDSNVWYYIDEAGNRYTGLITDNSTGKTYLLGETDGKMITADGTYTIQGSQKSLSFNQIHDGTFGALSEGSLTELRTSGMTEKTVDHVGGSTTTTETTETSSSTSTGAIGTVSEYGGIITEGNPAGLALTTSESGGGTIGAGKQDTSKANEALQKDIENGFYLIG